MTWLDLILIIILALMYLIADSERDKAEYWKKQYLDLLNKRDENE